MGDDLRAVAADREQHVQFQVAVVIDHLLRRINNPDVIPLAHREVEGVALVGRAQDRPSLIDDAGDVERREFPVLPLDHPFISIDDADDSGIEVAHGGFGNAADHRVETGAIAAAGKDANAIQFHRGCFNPPGCENYS